MLVIIFFNYAQCLGERHRLRVGAFRGQCIEDVDDREDTAKTGNRVAAQAIGIAGAFKALMVMANGLRRSRQPMLIGHNLDAENGMAFMTSISLAFSRSRLAHTATRIHAMLLPNALSNDGSSSRIYAPKRQELRLKL